MKLASLKTGARDGQLVVVDGALANCVAVPQIAPTLQSALDDWAQAEPRLRAVAAALDGNGHPQARPFELGHCAAPLPRAYHWADGSAYVNHIALVRKSRGADLPPSYWQDPLIYQGGSDDLLGPCDAARFVSEAHGIDLEAEVAVVTDDVPMASSVEDCATHVRLIMLANDWSLRGLIPGELAKGFGFYQSKPATAFSPVAVTPEELGHAWRDGKVHLPLLSHINGKLFGRPNAGVDMTFSFFQIIAHAARTRRLGAGSIIGSGTVSNLERAAGSACLIERRTLEQLEHGAPLTPYLSFGDRVRIEMLDDAGKTIFGALDQQVTRA